MGLQLIFAVESNQKSKSDWIYIKETIDHFYRYDRAHVKFSPVYMDGKGNYKIFLNEVRQYCESRGYAFVWFCKDIERVYTGKKIDRSQKAKAAVVFKAKKRIAAVDGGRLSADRYQKNTSNLMRILDRYLIRVRQT